MKKQKVYLTLQNGKVFEGYRFGAEKDATGELVFTTGMVGYLETLTEPANYGQIVVQTFPLIGNYGVMRSDLESKKAWVKAYVVREICDEPSNFRSEGKLDEFLKEENVVGIYGVDTREITKILRDEGVMNATISSKPLKDLSALNEYAIHLQYNQL
jgi:carbamoyl-phosphate synthase small subunit